MTMKSRGLTAAVLSALTLLLVVQNQSRAEGPFKLGVEEKEWLPGQDPNGYQYPAPQAIPTQKPLQGNLERTEHKKKSKPLRGNLEERQPTPRPPQLNANLQQQRSVALPPAFMGDWLVYGTRQQVEAQPQFQEGAANIFAPQTQNRWTITGDPNSGYAFTNDMGVSSAIYVDKVSGDTAFIRYQHPIKNTMAQEAIVMQLVAGGAQFNGLERISIVKQGEPVRAKVTYQLMGRRAR